ncbi:NUDIX hydrolase [Luteitalea sp.]|uniref:NUDIX hydrolase n=1 Tax=Luteitalea sp. TaxID=2004800 RepID=UPI0037C52BD3
MSQRLYPSRPIVGVGGVIVDGERLVLIKRKYEPLANRWSIPGGTLEVGESLEDGVARELFEETGLVVRVGPVIEVFDRILRDEDGRVKYHFVLVDYLCLPVGGTLQAGDDVSEAEWARFDGLAPYALTDKASSVIARARQLPLDW